MKNSVKWTPSQSAAINLRDRTLLVSAAAGSGKTAVLTERIIRRLTDENAPADISRMLIVTFTKAAAAELRSRISRAISSAIADDPTNKHLSRQLLLLSSAKICTIHSFCLDIIRKNASLLSLPDKMSVASEPEIILLSKEIFNEILDNAYSGVFEEGFEIENFTDFIDLFSSKGNDKNTVELFLEIYKKILSYPEGIEFLHIWANKLHESAKSLFFLSEHGKIILNDLSEYSSYVLMRYQSLYEKMRENDEVAFSQYVSLMSNEISYLESVSSSLKSARFDLVKNFNAAFTVETLPRLKSKYKSTFTEALKDVRADFKKLKTDKIDTLCKYDEASLSECAEMTAVAIDNIYKLLSAFDTLFKREKCKIEKLDFNDIERYAFSLLVNSDGTPSNIAVEASKDYDEIYIDEYQDTNSVQDMIFSSISTPYNRFMVGDIKQSIYSFRGAAPENFARYRDSFTQYDVNAKNTDFSPCSVFLADNFRCDNSVVDFCNRIFSRLFTNNTGRIKYYPSDDLVCSKIGGKDNTFTVNVVLAHKNDDDKELISESDYIANEISDLLNNGENKDGSKIKPSDIAVLIRSWDASIAIEKALTDAGIPTNNNAQTEFFENPEILLMMSLLNTIDNPLRDIYLAGVLKSPLFGFSLDELISVRVSFPDTSLYEALISYSDANNFEKGKYFLCRLDYFRELTTGMRIDKLVWKLYRECDMFALCAKARKRNSSVSEARQNLMLLYKYARDFEASSFKGLSAFIKYIDDIISNRTQLPNTSGGSESAESVKIMTIHQSKGLEYPVIFLASTHKSRSNREKASPVLFERDAGISVDLTDKYKISRLKTLHRKALQIRIDDNSAEEEMRVLYVALTRARERLYVTGNFKNPEQEIEKAKKLSENLCRFTVMKYTSYMSLILMCLYNSGEGNYTVSTPQSLSVHIKSKPADKSAFSLENSEEFFENIKRNMSFEYPYKGVGLVPSKIAVSDLSSDIFGSDLNSSIADTERKLAQIKPEFMSDIKGNPTGAEKGTATHIFMQFCSYENAEINGALSELKRLVNLKFINSDTAKLVDIDKVDNFFKSRLYLNTVKKAEKVYREYRFNVKFPASDFTEKPELKTLLENETLFVQGVMDCFVKNSDGTFTLIDYKTDRIPNEMKNDKTAAIELIKNRHTLQLSYYKRALEFFTKCKVSKVYIYSFGLNKEIDITEFCLN